MTQKMKKNYNRFRSHRSGETGYRQRAIPELINFDEEDSQPTAVAPSASHFEAEEMEELSGFNFVSFGSGSSGNCSFLGNKNGGVLIDAGIDPEHVYRDLSRNGIAMDKVKGILLTHDHADHIRYAYKLVRENKHMRIYCTPRLMGGLLRHHNVSRRIRDYQKSIWKEESFFLAGMKITAFETSHDAFDNMGFSLEMGGKTFVVATDMGVITPRAEHYMSRANFLMIESNYDLAMLTGGRYPEYLKARVRGEKGHLDNEVAARFVASHYHDGLKWVFLCHLSNDNNRPELAVDTMSRALTQQGLTVGDGSNSPSHRDRDVQVYALPRYDTSALFVL